MSQSADERLVVMLEARVSDFEKRMAKAEGTGTRSYNRLRQGSRGATAQMEADMNRTTSRINQALATTSTTVGTFSKAFVVGLAGGAITAAFAGLTSGLNATVRGIAQLGDEAKRSGLGLQAFQEWKFVAEQNRIGIDALVDGFKELNLRADEFIVTGGGSASEAFMRLGFTAEDLKKKLKDPSALMLEIIGRLEGLDKAAQIRIADELFGGTGGEQFVQLLDQGEAGIRKAIATAHEFGGVMSQEMVDKADELDRKWQAVTSAIGTGFQKAAVHTADFIGWLTGLQASLDELLGDEGRARTILGNDVYEDLKKNQQAVDENAESIAGLDQAIQDMQWAAHEMAVGFAEAAQEAAVLGNTDLEAKLMALANEMNSLQDQFNNGDITGEQLAIRLIDVRDRAVEVFDALSEADKVSMDWAIEEVGRLGGALMAAAGMARSLAGWLAHVAGVDTSNVTTGTPLSGPVDGLMPPAPGSYLPTSPRPVARPDGWQADMDGDGIPDALQKDDKGGGKGKKGGGKKVSEDEKEAKRVIDETRTATELLVAEMEKLEGLRDRGLIDLDTFERARDQLMGLKDLGAEVGSALHDAFTNAFDDPKEALKGFAKEILSLLIRTVLIRALTGSGMDIDGGFGGVLMSALSGRPAFSVGGYTGPGGVHEPAGVVHKGEVVWSQRDIARAGGVATVEAMRRGVRGYATGGVVGGGSPISSGQVPQINIQNYGSPDDVRASVTRQPDLGYMVELVVNEKLARGRFDKSMQGRYNARPPVGKR